MRLAWWQSGLLAIAVVNACRCGDSAPAAVARVGATNGTVERNPADDEAWLAAARGDEVLVGGAVRTGEASTARVDLVRGGGGLNLGELSVIRFARSAGDATQLELQTGTAEIETGELQLALATPGGTLQLRSGTKARAVRRGDELDIEIIVGSAEIETEGDPATATPIPAGGAVTVRPTGVTRRADAGPAPPTGDDSVRIDVPGGTIVSRRASEADLTIPAGESATVHVVRPPVPVRVQFGDACPGNAVLEVATRKSFAQIDAAVEGRDNAIATLGKGTHYYRVRCADGESVADQPAASGELRVRRDTRKRIRSKAPTNEVEADGRRYTVLFQNAKPRLTFRWTRATPSKAGYKLTLEDKRGRTRTFKGKKPAITVRPGKLSEGTYEWYIAAASSDGARSPTSTLRIEFDNAAPAAHIRRPRHGARWSSDEVVVEGTAVRGSSVSADGVELPLDRHYRFKATVAPPPDSNAIAIRIAHASSGVHYYVRRRATQ